MIIPRYFLSLIAIATGRNLYQAFSKRNLHCKDGAQVRRLIALEEEAAERGAPGAAGDDHTIRHPEMSVNAEDLEGDLPLHAAARSGNSEIVELLLKDFEIDVNAKNKKEHTALQVAATSGYADVVKLLLRHPKLDVNAGKFSNGTALHAATTSGHTDVVKLLLSH